ncbi:unnamed protein product [Sphagnum balticum]
MLRSRLKYALTYREVVAIVMQRLIAIDGKYKLCKLRSARFGEKGVPHITTFDGRTIRGRFGVIQHHEKHKGSFDVIHVVDPAGHQFAAWMGNVFSIGQGMPWFTLPQGKGIKLSIVDKAKKWATLRLLLHSLVLERSI